MDPTPGIHSRNDWHVAAVDVTGSTNDDLLRAAERGELVDRSVLRTDHQTVGRGRLDRRWDAPPGTNLLASMYLAAPGEHPGAVVQRVGVSIVRAVTALVGAAGGPPPATLGLKWPNDVMFDGRKMAGVLAQRSTAAPGIVVGFGVNVGWSPPEAADVAELVNVNPAGLLDAVLAAFDELPDDPAVFAAVYRAELLTLGQVVRVHLPGDLEFVGVADAVDADGRIEVVGADGARQTFDVGDVVHLRAASAGDDRDI